jgi:SHS family lactate transporter-like MFS transporter
MMACLVWFSVMEVLSGLAPNFRLFMIFRALFGMGMGGYWGVAAALAMEKTPSRWRGIASGLLQQGYACGYLLAAFCFRLLPAGLSWRWLFIAGGLPALLALLVRHRVSESAVWKQTRRQDSGALLRAVAGHWKLFVYLTLLMTMMNFASHGTQDLYPSFLGQERHLSKSEIGDIAMIYNMGAILGGVCFGLWSDRQGRRHGMVLAFILAILVLPLWAFAPSTGLLVAGAFLMQFMVQGAWGIIPAHITELSPDAVRGFLPGFAYQCGVLLAANAAYLEAQLSKQMSYASAMALTALATFGIGAIVILAGPERRAVAFGTVS